VKEIRTVLDDFGGVIVATALPFKEDSGAPAGLAVDWDAFAEHCRHVVDQGCRGVGPNGSLGEYSSLTDAERRRVIQVAVEALDGKGVVVAGAHGVGAHQARRWAELAAEDGADGVLLLPPTIYRASESDVLAHYAEVDKVGIPIMAYNNPFDTKVDLPPPLLARIGELDNVIAVKEFSGDIRRVGDILDQTDLQVVAGADDLLFEALVAGATGWFAGYPNALPAASARLFRLVVEEGRIGVARSLFNELRPLFAWDSKVEFVQAIKLSMDLIGASRGGPTRPPRGPLTADQVKTITAQTERAQAAFEVFQAADDARAAARAAGGGCGCGGHGHGGGAGHGHGGGGCGCGRHRDPNGQ
jgi:4-hydroxy-tetrahydrodipicolinate synthase